MTIEFYNNFIMGAASDADWDEYVSSWKNLGGDDWTREANAQYQDLMK